MPRKALFLLTFLLLTFSTQAWANPILLTLAETDVGGTTTWWPSQFGADASWIRAFSAQGLEIINPAAIPVKPKISPAVYPSAVLSSANARMLGSLFGTENILNGTIHWQCDTVQETEKIRCTAQANLTLIYGKKGEQTLVLEASASAMNKLLAQEMAAAQIASRLALPILRQTATLTEIPALTDNPVIVLQNLPDADTLVSIRKRLKRIAGVGDVAERWIASGALALEIIPDTNKAEPMDFAQIVQAFIQDDTDNFSVREMQRTDLGVSVEILMK